MRLSMTFIMACLCAPLPAQAEPQAAPVTTLSIDEALARAAVNHPQIQAAKFDLMAAQASAHVARSKALPRLDIADNHSFSHSSFRLGTNFIAGLGPISSAGRPQDFSANVFSAGVKQPLVGLLHIAYDHLAQRSLRSAKEQDLRAARMDVHTSIQTGYLQLFEAHAVGETAAASERSLLEQVAEAKHEVAAGTLTTTDVLRLEAAAAGVRQQVILAEADVRRARGKLLDDLGLAGQEESIQFIEPTQLLEVSARTDLETYRRTGLDTRPELLSQSYSADAQTHRARAKSLAMLPEVDVSGSYLHLWSEPSSRGGQTGDLRASAVSVMLQASFNVWQWGGDWYARQEAVAQAHAAQARSRDLQRQVSTEILDRHATYFASLSAMDVARAQVQSAEEAFRVVQVQVRAGAATTTDLLNVEAAQTDARMSLVRSRYSAALAHVMLRRATGLDA